MLAAARRTSRATITALDRQRRAGNAPLPDGEGQGLSEQLHLLALEKAQLERELTAARQRIADLEAQADTLAARAAAHRAFTRNSERMNSALLFDGRPVVNQTEAARLLNVKQYQISRWVAAGHFQTVIVGARTLLFADTLHQPAPKNRKKKGTK